MLLGRVKVSTANEFDLAIASSSSEDKKIEMNEEAYEDLILNINRTTSQGKEHLGETPT